ncbi:hypothetical protein ACX27_27715 [Nostoc piscinale CENA21]|uniref:Uncharacterized protein n=1 Tax=Nostoc piscinale CENA21 TaxID=224013 RepID=A0A0M4SQC3_9NOSO|nr:hypothetical protein [Nostoc piscinale]ALF55785.1 hypothetical protein ACX27_27715 [Nostoc piscinale CENA21]
MKQDLPFTYNFQIIDEFLVQNSVNPLSLSPQKQVITRFAELESLIEEETTDIRLISNLQNTLECILEAQLENFPDNIFWDCDFMVSSILRQALAVADEAIGFLKMFTEKMVALSRLFGIHQEIRFCYVHDFMYGFEWARWVQKDPQNRAHIEPFSLFFLDYLLAKGQELIHRINHEQPTYYQLCATGFRNPFPFSREPEDEYRLLTYLANEGLIPVTAWNWHSQPVWNQPFQEIRQQLALQLNIQPQRR